MPADHILDLLIAERDKLTRAIVALQGSPRRGGRPRKNSGTTFRGIRIGSGTETQGLDRSPAARRSGAITSDVGEAQETAHEEGVDDLDFSSRLLRFALHRLIDRLCLFAEVAQLLPGASPTLA
jgi:hypothetical protein